MRLLFLLPHPLIPPDRGNKHHTLNLLRYIAHEHDCDVIGFEEPGGSDPESWLRLSVELPRVRVLRVFRQTEGNALRWGQLKCLLKGLPIPTARYHRDEVEDFIRTLDLEEYDLCCIDMFMLVRYQCLLNAKPTVLISTDAYSMMMVRAARVTSGAWRRAKFLAYALLQACFERRYYPLCDAVAVVSPVDGAWLRRISPQIQIELVEIPVSDELLKPTTNIATTAPQVLCWELVSDDGVAAGVASFVRNAWPLIRAEFPNAELVVWGRNPSRKLRHLLLNTEGVHHLDYVDDWVSTLRQATLFVYPQRCGSGLQTKIQAAMAVGLPVVISRECIGGLSLIHGENGFVAGTDREFADCCTALLRDPQQRSSVGSAARRTIQNYYSSYRLGNKMLEVFARAAEHHKARRVDRIP